MRLVKEINRWQAYELYDEGYYFKPYNGFDVGNTKGKKLIIYRIDNRLFTKHRSPLNKGRG